MNGIALGSLVATLDAAALPSPLSAALGNPWMLAWGAAVIVPILLHLWRRRRSGETNWAAMALLRQVVQQYAHRRRVARRILLVVRMAAILLLALVLADPRWGGAAPGAGQAARPELRHLILILDTSGSMAASSGHRSAFQRAQAVATELVGRLAPGDYVSLFAMSDTVVPVIGEPTVDHPRVMEQIALMAPDDVPASASSALSAFAAFSAPEEVQEAEHRVVVISDLQSETWRGLASDSPRMPANVHVIDVGEEGLRNRRVESLTGERPIANVGQPWRFHVQVADWGGESTGVQLELLIDGKPVRTIPIRWNGQRGAATGTLELTRAGTHDITVRLPEDDLQRDNSQTLRVQAVEQIPVSCVYGDRELAVLLRHALEPLVGQNGPFRPNLVAFGQWPVDTNPGSVWILADNALLDASQWDRLRRWVERGGSLIVIAGPAVQPVAYVPASSAEMAEQPLLPALLGEVAAGQEQHWSVADSGDPLIRALAGRPEAGLESTPVWRYWKLQPHAASNVHIPLRFSSGDPALIWHDVGKGCVVMVATTSRVNHLDDVDQAWSAWGLWPSFVPLVHQMVHFAAARPWRAELIEIGSGAWHLMRERSGNGARREAGRLASGSVPAELPTASVEAEALPPRAAVPAARESATSRWVLSVAADGTRPEANEQVVSAVRMAGVYERLRDDRSAAESDGPLWLVAVPPASESDLRRIERTAVPCPVYDVDQWPRVLESGNAVTVQGPRPLFPWLILGVMALVLLEQALMVWTPEDRLPQALGWLDEVARRTRAATGLARIRVPLSRRRRQQRDGGRVQ